MRLSPKTLEKLREIINGDGTEHYRGGSALVSFFNQLGFRDVYGKGFPSRWIYTDERLEEINGTPALDNCIKKAFAVIDYAEAIEELDKLIDDFNRYMVFDKWAVVRENDQIKFKKLERVIIEPPKKSRIESKEENFLKQKFNADIDTLNLAPLVHDVLKSRIAEADICINNNAPLSAIFLIGSVLEGILLGTATANPQLFNRARCAPRDKTGNTVRVFQDWTLSNFIDAAAEIGILGPDVKKFSHAVRDFRNYIHPYQQMTSRFYPDIHTALICSQVLKAAVSQLTVYQNQESNHGQNEI